MNGDTSTSPRVLIVIGQLDVGGAERHLAQVAPALRARGLDVNLFALKPGGALAADLRARGIPVWWRAGRRPGLFGLIKAGLHLARHLRSRPYDIVHFFLPAAYLVGMLASLGLPVKRVMSRRSLAFYQRRYPGVRPLERWLHRRLAAAIANSAAVARELRVEGVESTRLAILYNGVVDHAAAHERLSARSSHGLGAESLVFVMVANLIAYKGHADLLQALALAAERLPHDWTMLCAGRDDGIGESLRAQAKQLGIDAHLRWLGAVDEVGPLLAAADIGVLASHEEGFSNAVLEGMAAGLPMVVTDVGGNAEAVVDGVCGRVVPARDPAALAAALLELANAPAERLRMGEAARARAVKHFTLEACVARYEMLYRNLCAGIVPPLPPPVLDE